MSANHHPGKESPFWLAAVTNQVGLAWWVEIHTHQPHCTYFFGPFMSLEEANTAKPGYIEDLEAEQAQGIVVKVHRCKPKELTIVDATEVAIAPPRSLVTSGASNGRTVS